MTTSNDTLRAAPIGMLARFDALTAPLVAFLRKWRFAMIALVVIAQVGVLIQMVAGREMLLANGRQIDLNVVPVDPRDFFRGDYVTLGYDISRLSEQILVSKGTVNRGDRINVRLQQKDAMWQAVEAATTPLTVGPQEVLLVGRVTYASTGEPDRAGTISVEYGIEKFFVPEGTGRDIEQDVSNKKVVAHIAVANDGTAAIRALSVDGQRIDIEPLF